mgnify:CR=1 FL=1
MEMVANHCNLLMQASWSDAAEAHEEEGISAVELRRVRPGLYNLEPALTQLVTNTHEVLRLVLLFV